MFDKEGLEELQLHQEIEMENTAKKGNDRNEEKKENLTKI